MWGEDLSDDDSSDGEFPENYDDPFFDLSSVFSKLLKKHKKCGGDNSAMDQEVDDSGIDKLLSSMMDIVKSCILTPKQILKLSTLDAKANLHKRSRITRIQSQKDKGYRTMGRWSDDELTLLRNRWSTFCAEYGFDETEDLKMFVPNIFCPSDHKLSYAQREWFLQHLCQDFPDRDPEQVYEKFVDVFLTWKKGTWTAEEDEFLLTFYNLMPDMSVYSISAFILHRKRTLVHRRLMTLTHCCAPIKRILKLKKAKLSEAALEDPNAPEYPEWTKSDKKWKAIAAHGNINRRLLMRKYYFELNPAIRAAGFQSTKMDEKEVLRCLKKEKPSSWDSVDWHKIGRMCNNMGAVRAYHIIRQMAIRRVHAAKWDNLPAVLEKLNRKKPSKSGRRAESSTEEETVPLDDESGNMSDSV